MKEGQAMKAKHYLLVVSAVIGGALLLSFLTSATGAPAQRREGTAVAVCDVVAVFNNYDRLSDLNHDLDTRLKKIAKEIEARASVIRDKEEMLKGIAEGSREYEKQLQEVQRLKIELQAWGQYQETLVARDRHRLTTDMYDQILDTVDVVSKEQGFKIVLFRETRDTSTKSFQELLAQMSNRKILYSDPSIDLTERVLARLNDQYEKSKGR